MLITTAIENIYLKSHLTSLDEVKQKMNREKYFTVMLRELYIQV